MNLKQFGILAILCLTFCFSCSSDDDENVIKTECTVSGTLKYSNSLKAWIINETFPYPIIDSINEYIIKGYKVNKSKNATFSVEATGNCWLYKDQTGLTAGHVIYNIEINSLKYNSK
jgi:hypothetical protein